MVGLPRSQLNDDARWLVVDQLTKIVHFVAYNLTYSVKYLSHLYIQHIIHLHCVPVTFVSDRDSRFTVEFGRSLQTTFEMPLNLSLDFYP